MSVYCADVDNTDDGLMSFSGPDEDNEELNTHFKELKRTFVVMSEELERQMAIMAHDVTAEKVEIMNLIESMNKHSIKRHEEVVLKIEDIKQLFSSAKQSIVPQKESTDPYDDIKNIDEYSKANRSHRHPFLLAMIQNQNGTVLKDINPGTSGGKAWFFWHQPRGVKNDDFIQNYCLRFVYKNPMNVTISPHHGDSSMKLESDGRNYIDFPLTEIATFEADYQNRITFYVNYDEGQCLCSIYFDW